MGTSHNKDITLEQMMRKITAQQNLRGVVFQDMTDEQKMAYANECVLALHVEVSELASSWPFASWKTTETDTENIEREIIDCIFFLTNIARCFNIDSGALESRFGVVLDNNQRRIDDATHKPVTI